MDEAGGRDGHGHGRLVVVSNRVPVPSKSGAQSAGGLAVALDGALKQRGGIWFGWSGKTSNLGDGAGDQDGLSIHQAGPVTFAVSDLSKKDLDEYYFGFANRTLWPVCHYRLDLVQVNKVNTAGYFRVNDAFARKLARMLRPDDVVWIHDYHFIPLAAALRKMGFSNRIGFFLHIPWPPSDIASALPVYDNILRCLTAYDLVGFHTQQDADNFANCLVRERMGRAIGQGWYEAAGRRFQIGAFPVGIDTNAFARTAREAERNPLVRRMTSSIPGKDLIIGVDRLDYSKGIGQRIDAFSCFIRHHPYARNRVTYLQITPKSRSEVPEYRKMQHEVAEQVGSTNGSLGDVDWTPIRYVNKNVAHSSLAGLYRMAQVGLVTPLRDGMNLVAKEYVAAQRADDPGVLVLSRFAGAAHEMDGALLVNPYDVEATGQSIGQALAMPADERKERWEAMMSRLRAHTVEDWCENFLKILHGDDATAPPRTLTTDRAYGSTQTSVPTIPIV